MDTIRLKYTDFWRRVGDGKEFIFTRLLSKHYNVEIVNKDEKEGIDLLIYSCFGDEHLRYDNCLKLFFSGENLNPNFNECDYAIASPYLSFGSRYLRIPLFLLYPIDEVEELYGNRISGGNFLQEATPDLADRDFCSLVISNFSNRDPVFFEFEEKLSAYKPITYGGKYKNNVGGLVKDKLEFISKFKFNIAFENSEVEGYTTEKLIEPIYARTVPIYWGNSLVSKDINPESYINLHDFDSVDSCVDYIIKVDKDPQLYMDYFKHRPIVSDTTVVDKLEAFLLSIVTDRKKYIQPYGYQNKYNKRRKKESALYRNGLMRAFYPLLKK